MVEDYDADDGFNGSVSKDGNVFTVTGEFTDMSGMDDDVKGTTGVGYYLPIEFTNGQKDMILKRQDTGLEHVFGQTGDTDTTMILLLHINPSESKIIKFTQYADKSAADSDTDGIEITVDCSGCSFN